MSKGFLDFTSSIRPRIASEKRGVVVDDAIQP